VADVVITTGTNKVIVTFAGQYANGLSIAAGGSKKIELVADLAAPTVTSSIVTTLRRNTNVDYTAFAASSYAGPATVVWSDNAEPNVTAASVDWFTDAGIDPKATTNSWVFNYKS
jgi:hypothetical protein